MKTSAALLCFLATWCVSFAAQAITTCPAQCSTTCIKQPSGIVIPDSTRAQGYLDKEEGGRTIDSVCDASIAQKTFLPQCALTFKVIARGSIWHNIFGWYNVAPGKKPADSDLHPILLTGDAVGTVKTATIKTSPYYKGGEIGFFMATGMGPVINEGVGYTVCSGVNPNCPSPTYNRNATGCVNWVVYSESQYNPDSGQAGAQNHLLTWQSVTYKNSFYFGWEDLLCTSGNDNDFEDLMTRVEGVYCSGGGAVCDTGQLGPCGPGHMQCKSGMLQCIPDHKPTTDVCNAVDDNCDGQIDEPSASLCPNVGDICDRGVCVRPCGGGEFVCTGADVCNSRGLCVDPLCTDTICPAGQVCKAGVCGDGCGNVTCPVGQKCWLGRCIDPCVGVTCDLGYSCVDGVCLSCACDGCAAGLSCVSNVCVDPACASVTCPQYSHCESGKCVDNCQGVVCPNGETCTNGQCPGGVGTAGAGGGITIPPDSGIIIIGSGGTGPAPDGGVGNTGGSVSSAGSSSSGASSGTGAAATGVGGSGNSNPTARPVSSEESSCGCRVPRARSRSALVALLALGVVAVTSARRRARRRHR
ncbi:MAG TPA: DUF4114 domain-containing protein [Polyangiaceae bacterium]